MQMLRQAIEREKVVKSATFSLFYIIFRNRSIKRRLFKASFLTFTYSNSSTKYALVYAFLPAWSMISRRT